MESARLEPPQWTLPLQPPTPPSLRRLAAARPVCVREGREVWRCALRQSTLQLRPPAAQLAPRAGGRRLIRARRAAARERWRPATVQRPSGSVAKAPMPQLVHLIAPPLLPPCRRCERLVAVAAAPWPRPKKRRALGQWCEMRWMSGQGGQLAAVVITFSQRTLVPPACAPFVHAAVADDAGREPLPALRAAHRKEMPEKK